MYTSAKAIQNTHRASDIYSKGMSVTCLLQGLYKRLQSTYGNHSEKRNGDPGKEFSWVLRLSTQSVVEK